MTPAQHTPGPWTVGREMNSERPGSVPVVALVRDSLGGRMHVAFVNGKAGEQGANANLIAAAPDLLAACDMALRWMVPHAGEGDPASGAVRRVLRSAISRATGGAS